MESQRTYRASAIILRRINIGESDRVVTLYTREKGKVSAVAKGARKHMSKLAGPTEPLTYGRYFLAAGRDLDIVTQAEVKESFPQIKKNLNRIGFASYMVELINAIVEEHDPNYEAFDTLLSSLYLLESDIEPELVARYFELQIMSMMGYRPELDECLRCGRQPSSDVVAFSPELGGRACEECAPLPTDVIILKKPSADAMRQLLSVEPEQLKNIQISDDAKDPLYRAIRWYVRCRLDRNLKSSEFLQTLTAMSGKPLT